MKTKCIDKLLSLSDLLALPSYVREEALKYLSSEYMAKFKNCDARVAVSIYLSARDHQVPLSSQELVSVIGVSKNDLLSWLWRWNKIKGEPIFMGLSDDQWIPQTVQRLGLPTACEVRARAISNGLVKLNNTRLDVKKRVLLSSYVAGLELGAKPNVFRLSRQERLWLLRSIGFGRSKTSTNASLDL
ncbi:MAG: hypothetical protein ACP5T2_06780 [Thermoprotei archaeon]